MTKKVEWKEKKVNLSSAIIIGAVFAVIGAVLGANWNNIFGQYAPYLGLSDTSEKVNWSSLNEVYNKLSSTYNGEIDKGSIIDGAKKGLTAALGDKYTIYMDSKETEDFYNDLHGSVGAGIGVELGERDGYVRVLRTLPDNPAREAGMLAGDIFYKINDEEVYTMTSEEISKRLRGEPGTEVTVTVARDKEEKTFTLTREEINNVSAYVDYKDNTAIITITRFDDDTGKMVQGFAREFNGKGINKVILDLRGNGGGYVNAAVDLLSLWIDGDVAVQQKSLKSSDSTMKTSRGQAILSEMKTIVLVNGSTASASEITAGALQDYGKATVVGEQTYGKGVVQTLYNLSDGATLKVTTADWHTPKDRSINGEGIKPDVEVERSYDDINNMRDPQMDKALSL
ncbi:S41 family peptidase [Candidatus Saccharibacteria bacterium]|nr:S41 family peptidase [Candidatus Saccharibacteria bacterium]